MIRHAPTCHELPVWQRTHKGGWFHRGHQRTVVDNDGSRVSLFQPAGGITASSQQRGKVRLEYLPRNLVALCIMFKSYGEIPSVIELSE